MNIDVFCVFPEAVDAALRVGVVGRAIERGVVGYRSFDLRAFSRDGRIDDMPYGGGAGMVVRVDVVARAFEEVYGMSAAGPDLTIVCGRYGGVDERVWTGLCTEAVSLGDFVLSGGEIVAAALGDAVLRRMDGVLGNRESLVGESFSGEGVVGPPMYTRPASWDGEEVPGVLLSGNHAEIRAWRERESRTRARAREAGRRSL